MTSPLIRTEAPDPPRRVLITGVGRGIGLGLVRHLTRLGHDVWGTVRSQEACDLALSAGASRVDIMDLSQPDSIHAFGATMRENTEAIDVLVNNAGINSENLGSPDRFSEGPFQTSPEMVLDQININALSPLLVIRELQPLLHNATNPIVLNISSQLGSMQVGAKMPFDLGYNASKAVLNMITVCAATADPQITYVALHPGWVQSDMGGQHAAISVAESARGIAEVLISLTSEDSGRFLTWNGEQHPW